MGWAPSAPRARLTPPHLRYDIQKAEQEGRPFSLASAYPLLMGQCCGSVKEVKPAAAIVEELTQGAIASIRRNSEKIARL